MHSRNSLWFHQSENLTISYNGSTFKGSVSIIKAHLFFSSSTPDLMFLALEGNCSVAIGTPSQKSYLNVFPLRFLLSPSVLSMSF